MSSNQATRAFLTRTITIVLAIALVPLGIVPGFDATENTQASPAVSGAFGEPGLAVFDNYEAPPSLGDDGGEPGIGVVYDSGAVWVNDFATAVRVLFDDDQSPPAASWDTSRDNPFSIINVDPLLFLDQDKGRLYQGGLDGLCSINAFTDDDGLSWTPQLNACSLPGWDHQTLGAGPWKDFVMPPDAIYDRAVYYCAQTVAEASCSVSYDGGLTFAESVPMYTLAQCGGLHGHVRVGPFGTAYVPNKNCGSTAGIAVSETNGLTWTIRSNPQIPDTGRFDPSVGPTQDSGWIYFGQAARDGPYIGLSKDNGLTWEDVGQGNGAPAGTKGFNLADLVDPPIKRAEFAEVIAGDDDRAAFAFLGSTSSQANSGGCTSGNDHVWYMYIAMTYDAGQTWDVQKAYDNPIHRGAVGNSGSCRGMLDFNDITIDAEGRVLVVSSQPCVGTCDGPSGTVSQSQRGEGEARLTIHRQTTGLGLLSEYDGGGDALLANANGPYNGLVGSAITFTGTASGGTPPYTFDWDFGDGSTDTGASVTHTYASSGTYLVSLTVTDDAARERTVTTTATASGTGGEPIPFANITSPGDGDSVRGVQSIIGEAGHKNNGGGGESLTFAGLDDASVAGTTASLAWTPATGGTGPYTYLVYQGTAGSIDLVTPVQEVAGLSTSVSGLTAGVEVCFVVRAKDSTGSIDTNTVELCVTPPATSTTMRLYYHGGELVDAPSGAPDNAKFVRGTMDQTIGAAPKEALIGGGIDHTAQEVAFADDVREAYPATFETAALTDAVTLAGGLTTHTGSSSGLEETVAAGVQVVTCLAGGLEGGFQADVFELKSDGTAVLVLTADGYDWADTNVIADGPDGRCVSHSLKYAGAGASSHTFSADSTILVGLQPDFFAGSVATQFKWDGDALYKSYLEMEVSGGGGGGGGGGGPAPSFTDATGDGSTPESDIVAVTVAPNADHLIATVHLADLATPQGPDGGSAGAQAYTYNLEFVANAVAHEYEAYPIAGQRGLWAYALDAESSGSVVFDYANDAVTFTIPWSEIGAASGDGVTDFKARTWIGHVAQIVADDTAPDADGYDFTVPSSFGASGDEHTLFIDGDAMQDLALPMSTGTTRVGVTLSEDAPTGFAPELHRANIDGTMVASSAPFVEGIGFTDGDAETVDIADVGIYVSSKEAISGTLDVTLSARTTDGLSTLGSASLAIDGMYDRPTLFRIAVPLVEGAQVLEGDSLYLLASMDGIDADQNVWFHFGGALAPSKIGFPTVSQAITPPSQSASFAGERVMDDDDPQDSVPGYTSMDIRQGFVSSDGTTITVRWDTYGFDPVQPAPGLGSYFWTYRFQYGGQTVALSIDGEGAVNPTLSGSISCGGCGGGVGFVTLSEGYPVTIEDDSIAVTFPLNDIDAAEFAPPGPGDTFTQTYTESDALVPGSGLGGAFILLDAAPGGGPEEYWPLTSGNPAFPKQFGNDFTIPDGPQVTPPTIESFAADVTSGNAPLEVTLSGTVTAGDNPIASVTLDLGDGSDPVAITLDGDTFSHTHVYEAEAAITATLTAIDTESNDATATETIDVGPLQAGVHVRIGDAPLVRAIDDSPGGNWTDWHYDVDFGTYEPGTSLTISASYFDGLLESEEDSIVVTVLEGGLISISSPAPGTHLEPEPQTIAGTTSDSANGGAAGQSTGMWDLTLLNDADQDRVDDLLEQVLRDGNEESVNIHVAFNRAVTDADAEALVAKTGAAYAYPIQVVDAVMLDGVPAFAARNVLDMDDVVFVEYIAPAQLFADVATPAGKARWSDTYPDECVWGGAGCLGYTGAGVGYANFDGGVRATHESFEWGQWAPPGASASDSKESLYLDPWNGDPSVQAHANHAVATAGMAVGTGGPSTEFAGVAPGSHLINVRTNKQIGGATGNSVETRTCASVDGIVANRVTENIRVASLSYGLAVPLSRTVDDACVNAAVDAGIVMVVSAGNLGSMGSPSSATKAIVVGNQDDSATVSRVDDRPCHGGSVHRNPGSTSFPICGVSGFIGDGTKTVNKPDLMAPGTGITLPTNANDGSYASTSGTSFSAPFVAGVVALMTEANPALTPAEIQEILRDTAHLGDLPPTGVWVPYIGTGFVDAHLAVEEAIARGGGQDLSVTVIGPLTTAPGVEIDLQAQVTGGTAPFTYLWDFGDTSTSTEVSPSHSWATEGTYTVTLTVTDANSDVDSDSTTVTVTSTLTAAITEPDAGSTVSGDVLVEGTSFFPPTDLGKSFNAASPDWTDAEGDGDLFGSGQNPQLESLDVVAGYAWGDEGVDDPDFNVGLGIKDIPPSPGALQYARYGVEFSFGGQDYFADSMLDPINNAIDNDPGLEPRGLLYERADPDDPTSSWTNGQAVDVVWDDVEDVVKFTLPKSRLVDANGDGIEPGDILENFIATANAGATAGPRSASGSVDVGPAPSSFTVTVSPTAGDPHTLVTFGALAPVRVDGDSWSLTVDSTLVLDGPTSITAVATDGVGGFSDPAIVSVNVDNGGGTGDPFVTIVTPTPSAIVSGTLGFNGTAGLDSGGSGGSASSVTLEPSVTSGAVPMPLRMMVDTDGPVKAWILDWGDGDLLQGLGDPTDLYGHVYNVPGTHEVVMTIIDALGRTTEERLTITASSHPAGEPGPSDPTLYFHVEADETTGSFNRFWVNADDSDPDDNTDGFGGSTGLSPDGDTGWALSPAPSQDLYLTPGGVGSATLSYFGAADIGTTIGVDVLVEGVVRASGSAVTDFIGYQSNEQTFNVLVDGNWDGTIPENAAVEVVTYYRTATGGWAGHIEYDFHAFSLTLPWATGPGGGGGGSTETETETYYGHDLATVWDSCKGDVVPMDQSPPTGEGNVGVIWFVCDQGVDVTMATTPLSEALEVSAAEPSQVTTYLREHPFVDLGVAVPVTVTAQVGTTTDPDLVGSTSATFLLTPKLLEITPIVLDVAPLADVTIPAGESLAVKIDWNMPVTGYYGAPYGSYGGGEDAPYKLDLKLVKDDVVTPPGQVQNLVATPGDTTVTLGWDAVSGADHYEVFRDGSGVGSTSATTFTDTGLTNDVTYSYTVAAVGPTGLFGNNSTAATATPTSSAVDEKVEVSVRSALDSTLVLAPTEATGIAAWDLDWDTTSVADGDYVATAVYTATDGRQASATRDFSVDNVPDVNPPTVSLGASATQAGPGDGITFTATIDHGGGSSVIDWDFDDGTTISGGAAVESHAYSATGFFDARVTVTNEAGSDSDTVRITVLGDRFVEVRILAEGTAGSEGGWSNATATGEDGSFATWEYLWDATGKRGGFDIEARFFDGFDLNGPVETSASVGAAPTAVLSATPSSVDMATTVTLDGSLSSAQPSGSIVEYRFDPGDGTGLIMGAASSADHDYATPGTYTATLVVIDDLGLQSEPASASVTVTNTPPVANATGPSAAVKTKTPVAFSGAGSFDPDGSIATYAWSFGDGATSTDVEPVHSYDDDGVYSVSLTVTDDLGAESTDTLSVTILNTAPRGVFAVTPADDFTLVERTLSAVGSLDPDGTIVEYRFTPGDGGATIVSTEDSATYSYDTPGTYTATLEVVDDDGASGAVESVTVTVRNRPVDLGSIGTQNVDEDQTLAFTILASDPEGELVSMSASGVPLASLGASFVDNGDGTADFSWTPGWFDAGTYQVTVTATDGDAAIDVSETFDIVVRNVDRPAVFDAGSVADRTVREQIVTEFTVSASDPDGDDINLVAFNLPVGAAFTDNGDGTGTFRWQPAQGTAGIYPIVLRAASNTEVTNHVLELTVSATLRFADSMFVDASPNETVLLGAIVENIATEPETLTFGASAQQTGQWVVRAPAPVTLAPGEVRTVFVEVDVPPASDNPTFKSPSLAATSNLFPGETMRLGWRVEVPVFVDVEMVVENPTVKDSIAGHIHATYLDGSDVTSATVTVEQTPSSARQLRSSTTASNQGSGVYLFSFSNTQHPSAKLLGHHDLLIEVDRNGFRQSFVDGYDVSLI